jgi:hypothetical protein
VGDRPDFGIETLFEAVATGRPAAIVEDMCLEAADAIEASAPRSAMPPRTSRVVGSAQ